MGRFVASTAAIRIYSVKVEFENNAVKAYNTVNHGGSNGTTDGRFRGVAYVLFTAAQNAAGTVRIWQEPFYSSGLNGSPNTGLYDAVQSVPEVAMTINNGTTIYMRVQVAGNAAWVAGDSFTMDTVVYEALN